MWTTEGIGLDYTGRRLYGFTAKQSILAIALSRACAEFPWAGGWVARTAVCPTYSCTMRTMTLRKLDPRLAAALWIGLIYATIPFVRGLREAFAARWPVELIAYAVVVIVIGAGAAAIAVLQRHQVHISLADILWLVGVAAIIVLWTRRLMGRPEEAVHFLEYGVLGVLLFQVFDDRVADATVYAAATLTGLLIGTVDEIIQWLVPGRFWDFRDIVLNGSAVALAQVAIWRLLKRPSKAISRSSWRLVCRLSAALTLLFTLCMAATPQRFNSLADHLPLPDRLAGGVDAICEYGYRHSVDERTLFRSRLSSGELRLIDRAGATELARDLDAMRGRGGLTRSDISPVTDPFGYEIRIHLFARNRNLNKALEHAPGSPVRRRHMTTVWRENLILENFFGSTLGRSSYQWGPQRREEIEAAQDPDQFFISHAGAHLITSISEGQLRVLLLALFAAFVICDVLCATRSRPESQPE
jgi:hypothetical protein